MITIIDEKGNEQNIEHYRQKIIVPDKKKLEIGSFLQQKEFELNQWNRKEDQGDWEQHWERFNDLIKEFLKQFAYTANLLDFPYTPSQKSLEQMSDFREWCDLETSQNIMGGSITNCEWINANMYHIEKLKRAGLDVQLSDSEREVIEEVEELCFQRMEDPVLAYTMFIKMFNRHRSLGLSTYIDPQRKKMLEAGLHGIRLQGFGLGLLCAAKRAGLTLPPIQSGDLDYQIQILSEGEYSLNQGTEEPSPSLETYISKQHHLHRLLL